MILPADILHDSPFASSVRRIYSGEMEDIRIVGGTRVSNSCVKAGPGGEVRLPLASPSRAPIWCRGAGGVPLAVLSPPPVILRLPPGVPLSSRLDFGSGPGGKAEKHAARRRINFVYRRRGIPTGERTWE